MNDLLNYEHRFASGKVVRSFTNYIDVQLDRPMMGVTEVRVMREHWSADAPEWRPGHPVPKLFVYDLASALNHLAQRGDAGHGFASMIWADPRLNPWDQTHPDHPVAGKVVNATVLSRASDRDVVVRIGKGLVEAFLKLQAVPDGRFRPLDELLPPGLELRAKVIEVDVLRCKVELSVQAWLADLERTQGPGPASIGEREKATPYVRYVDEGPQLAPIGPFATAVLRPAGEVETTMLWHGKGLLVIDDDEDFRRNLIAWLHQFGAAAWGADNAQHTTDLLAKHGPSISHVLVDVSLGSRDTLVDIVRLLLRNNKGRHLALISGMVDGTAHDGAERLRKLKGAQDLPLPLLAKPLKFHTVHRWLTEGVAPADATQWAPAAHWNHEAGPVEQDLALRAQPWLKALCIQKNAVAAIWVRCHDPGYDLVADHGILEREPKEVRAEKLRRVISDFGQSVVADVQQEHAASSRRRAAAGPLERIWPPGAQHVLAIPMSESPPNDVASARLAETDVVLVFSVEVIAEQKQAGPVWLALRQWWTDLVELERVQDRLLEDAVFATQGRVHSATLHEIRPLLQVFQAPKPWTHEQAAAWWESGQRLSRLVDGGLYNIRPERIAQVNLRHRLEALMKDFLWQFASRRFVTVIVHLPPENLVVTLPPEVFEQPLSNLIDNATKSCQHRRWAQVEVSVHLNGSDATRPLVLRVQDQGHGMTPQERRHLFKPRHTQQGAGGFGMGLYVSQRLARAAGGELVLVDNKRWGGCTFELRLPLSWGQQPTSANEGVA